MKIFIEKTPEESSIFSAKYILSVIKHKIEEKGKAVLAMPSDELSRSVYKSIFLNASDFNIDFKKVYVFQQMEYVGLSNKDIKSHNFFLKENFINIFKIPEENCYLFNGAGSEKQMDKQTEAIQKVGGFDLVWFSLSGNGSVAGNESASSVTSYYRLKTLSASSRLSILDIFTAKKFVPTRVFSMGMGVLNNTVSILLTASGVERSLALKACIENGVGQNMPLSVIQIYEDVAVIADREASLRLTLPMSLLSEKINV